MSSPEKCLQSPAQASPPALPWLLPLRALKQRNKQESIPNEMINPGAAATHAPGVTHEIILSHSFFWHGDRGKGHFWP